MPFIFRYRVVKVVYLVPGTIAGVLVTRGFCCFFVTLKNCCESVVPPFCLTRM